MLMAIFVEEAALAGLSSLDNVKQHLELNARLATPLYKPQLTANSWPK